MNDSESTTGSQVPNGNDACLGEIPGCSSACCGHGVEPPAIQWDTKPTLTEVYAVAEKLGTTLRDLAPHITYPGQKGN